MKLKRWQIACKQNLSHSRVHNNEYFYRMLQPLPVPKRLTAKVPRITIGRAILFILLRNPIDNAKVGNSPGKTGRIDTFQRRLVSPWNVACAR
jgi:hypothetical protein